MASKKYPPLPRTSTSRLQIARDPVSIDADPCLYESILVSKRTKTPLEPRITNQKTVLYLAYGSNLSIETFRGVRGIEPISQVNVYVPELRLTFDLAGIPYVEPCFSGTKYRKTPTKDSRNRFRDDDNDSNDEDDEDDIEKNMDTPPADIEKLSLLDLESNSSYYTTEDYHKDHWQKPLVGVVYEVNTEDYAHIIATEGGGRHYEDVVVPCFPFPDQKDYNPNDPTPEIPTTTPFMAHTLLSPSKSSYRKCSHLVRPDPSYAQPSARYLKLISDGARELNFPYDYRAYLSSIRPYTITTYRQRAGEKLFLLVLPIIQLFFALTKYLVDDDGIMPEWLANIFSFFFELMWVYYDTVSCRVFGDGERTIGDT